VFESWVKTEVKSVCMCLSWLEYGMP
jgi:hypothetical protein